MKTLVILDLEATCWEEKQDRTSEIIEIGAIRVDKESGEVIGEFNLFLKPRLNPKLSKFCKDLTSISQEQVDSGYDFIPAMDMFNEWLDKYDDEYIMSWGYYDKNQIERESKQKSYTGNILNKLSKKHINAKNQFAHIFGCKPGGLMKALSMLHLQFDGTHHRGIDDCRNIAKVYNEIKDKFFEKIYDTD